MTPTPQHQRIREEFIKDFPPIAVFDSYKYQSVEETAEQVADFFLSRCIPKEEIREVVEGMMFSEPNRHQTEIGRACHDQHNRALIGVLTTLLGGE